MGTRIIIVCLVILVALCVIGPMLVQDRTEKAMSGSKTECVNTCGNVLDNGGEFGEFVSCCTNCIRP